MPKLNPLGIAVASIAFYFVGFLWYGLIFSDAWMAAEGVTQEAADAESPAWMALGAVITVMQVVGLAIVLKWKGAIGAADAVKAAALLWALFALPFTLYGFAYTPGHDATLLMLDASHLLVGWIVAAVTLSLFRQK
ncbi:MAG: hypothetical protein A3E78_05975 [Alphaproteobacteria bacterium RIFCSPHIGHO2_12_FULL_63_12]|nr:MAG: hypothetical protein A3E78_05975 [Alphaproteobacteria bacterium RIFCSPHIGHO2_12_FULL_63_12]